MYLSEIITSEVRIKLLIELFSETRKHLYVRELTRRVGTEINAVRRELKRLHKAGIIKKEKRGNRLYYILRKDHPFYYELTAMVAKEVGIGKSIIDNMESLGKVKLALISSEYTEGRQAKENELDLLVVGEINLDKLSEIVKEVSALSKREINYTVLEEKEFDYLKSRRDVFLLSFLIAPNIFLGGDIGRYMSFK